MFTVRKLTDNVGAEITGLDLTRPLDAKTIAEVRAAWLDHVVVVMPGQAIDDDQQIKAPFGEQGCLLFSPFHKIGFVA